MELDLSFFLSLLFKRELSWLLWSPLRCSALLCSALLLHCDSYVEYNAKFVLL